MDNSKVAIIGAGGFARECLAELSSNQYFDKKESEIYFYVDEEFMTEEHKLDPKIRPLSELMESKWSTQVIVAIGDPKMRENIVNRLPSNTRYMTYISNRAHILDGFTVKIGKGSFICAGTIITTNVTIGKFSHLNLNTTVGHDTVIGDYFTSAPAVNISGNCTIGKRVYMGTNSATREKISIADDIVVGMGACVVKSLDSNGTTWVGNPARLL
jgi:sugar O-acyltransferase (sialic acid O-acetyltransferase NeuD family)